MKSGSCFMGIYRDIYGNYGDLWEILYMEIYDDER